MSPPALQRGSPFSFSCNRCSRCCRGKIIRINPYEVTRLARNLGMGTTRFLVECTEAGGTVLGTKDDGTCLFLTGEGCAVHPDRPLVCRLDPLGRHVPGDGSESFSRITLPPGCEGTCGKRGTIGTYLERQGVDPFIGAADRYLDLAGRMIGVLRGAAAADDSSAGCIAASCVAPSGDGGGKAAGWLDPDPVVSRHCRSRGRAVPTDAEETMSLHIAAVEAWLDTITGSGKEEK